MANFYIFLGQVSILMLEEHLVTLPAKIPVPDLGMLKMMALQMPNLFSEFKTAGYGNIVLVLMTKEIQF